MAGSTDEASLTCWLLTACSAAGLLTGCRLASVHAWQVGTLTDMTLWKCKAVAQKSARWLLACREWGGKQNRWHGAEGNL